MKIIIGPYKNYFGPYHLAEKLMFWVPKKKYELHDQVDKFGEWLAHGSTTPTPPSENILRAKDDRPKTWIYRFLLWVSSKRVQKVSVQIDPWDTYSMDHTLAYIVLPMLKQLKETKHGAPIVNNKDVPKELRSEDTIEGDVCATHFQKWDWVMDQMIFAFESKLVDWEEQFESGEHDMQWIELEDGMSEMVKGPKDTYKIDWVGRKAYQKRISNGFRLFGTYMESLWD